MLKVEHSIDYLKKGRPSSETFEGAKHVKQIISQRKTLRFKRSDDNPDLPENFKVGQAIGGGDCFFDSVAKGLKQLKPEMDFTVKSLREVCKRFAQSQLENDQSWLKGALRNEAEPISVYVPRIEFTADDIEQKSGSVNVLELTSPIWGRSEIEGRIICKEYNVKLHVVEKHVVEGKEVWLDQIVNSEGSRSMDSIDYNEENTIHIINRGNAHFEPILSTQEIQHNKRQSPDPSDYDDEITPEVELINIIKSRDSEEEKLTKIRKLFEKEPKPDINFQDKDNDTPLHIAIRKKELKVIEWLVKNGAKIDIKNSRGRTQLEVAQHLERQDIAEVLKSHIQPNLQVSVERPSTQQKRTRTDSKEDKSEDSSHKRPRTSLQAAEESRGRKRTQNEENELGAGQVKKLKTSEGYPASGLKSSLHGTVYQLKLLMLFLKRGLDQGYSFDLATEMDAAEKFDDVVFQYTEGGEEVYRFLQAKHKQDDNKKITVNDLLTEQDDEFSLQKYFISYRKIKQNPEFKGYKLKDFVICTNIDLEESLRNSFEPVEGEDNILRVNGEKFERLKLILDKFPKKKDLVSRLSNTSELNRLAKRLAKCVLENKPLDLKDGLFRSYHGVLGEKVIDVKNVEQREEKDNKGKEIKKSYAKFHSNFLDGSSQELENFRSAFLKAYQEMSKEQMNVNEFWQKMKARELQISQTFGKVFELDTNPQLTNSEVFAKAIANAMSVAKQSVVNIKREKGKGIIKDNINKLAGHVLIKKGDKEKDTYYFSSTFFDDNNKLPGNLESFKNELKAELESKIMEFDKDKYKFHIANFKTCEEEQLHLKTFLPDDYIEEEEIESFFEKLVFAVNQPNEIELGDIIKAEMGEDKDINLIDSELIASKFQEDMLNWMKEKKGRFFTHEDGKAFLKEAKQKISKLALIGPTLEYRAKIEGFGIAFSEKPSGLSNFLASHERQIFNLISQHKTILSSIKVCQTLKGIPEYQKDDSHIFVRLSSLLRMKDRVIKAFESSNLLVIECKAAEENVDELYHQLSKVTQSSDNKKIILITQENDPLANKFKHDFLGSNRYEEKIDERNSLTDLTNESQNKLLSEGKVIFQGEEVSVDTLIDERSKRLIDGKVLSRLINSEEIEIGKALTDSKYEDIKDYYIPRTFNRQVKIKKGLKEKDSEFLVTYNSQIDEQSLKENQDIVLISAIDNGFKELCNKYKKRNIHWLKQEGDDLIWQQSYGALSKLRDFIDTNEQAIQEYKPEKITDIKDRVVIISAEPGMGKSTVLNPLALRTKDSLWVIRINLLDYSTELNRETEKKTKLNEAEAIKFLYGTVGFQLFQEGKEERKQTIEKVLSLITVEDSKVYLGNHEKRIQGLNFLEIGLFNNFYNQGRIALLFDGFDEISPDYKEKVIELLQVLKNTKVEKIWITTRPYGIINQLEEKLNTFSYTLKPLSPQDQRSFLEKFWKKNLKLSELDSDRFSIFTDELFEKFSQSINDQKREFLTIPLQTWMIAQIFQDVFKEFYDSGEQKLSDEYKKKIEELNLDTLYERFIDIKFRDIRFGEKNLGMNTAKPDMKRIIEKEYKKFIADHGKLAVYSIFKEDEVRKLLPKKEIRKVRNLIKDIEQGKENTGIIERVVNNKPRFIHRTFAEYFAVKLISDELKLRCAKSRWNFLINIVFIEDYHNIRRFFESKLANDNELASLSSKNNHKERILELLLKEGEIEDSTNPLCAPAEEGLVKTVDFLLKSAEGDLDSLIKIINTPSENGLPLCLAIKNSQEEIIDILLKYVKVGDANRLIEIISPDDRHGDPPLLLALRTDDKIVDILLKDIPSNDQITEIICSAFNNEIGGIVRLASSEQISLSALKKYITKLNNEQQVEIFNDFSGLIEWDFAFIDELESFLSRTAFKRVLLENEEEITSAFLRQREHSNRSPDYHPESSRILALYDGLHNSYDDSYNPSFEEECLSSTSPESNNRKKREAASKCLFTWEDVDEFNEEEDEKRDFDRINIDSEKFVNYIEDLPERKQSQLIQLADKVKVTGESQSLVNKLIDNQKVISHLNRVGKISGMTMHGMMAKNVLSDFLNGDYQGVAINVGFIAGGQGFAKVAEAASLKGLKLASEGKLLLSRSLRAASPFLARGTSAFVVYDLVNQVKAFKNGTEEALVGVVGDSIYLGVDAAEIGIEIAEAFEVLEGVSSVTGPIGAAVGAVVFVGTDIYMAVKRVDKIDEIIHLTGKERFVEGLRAFIGMQPEEHIQELLQEKEVSNQLVKQGLEYLKQHSDIQSYVFPTGKSVVDSCRKVPYKTSVCTSGGLDGRCFNSRTVTRYAEECTTKFEVDLDNTVQLDKKRTDIKWSRAKPDNPSGGELFCLPRGNHERVPSYGSYLCENAIGITDLSAKTGNHTLINLGEGTDHAKGFIDSPNIFVVNNGSKRYFGGNKDDIFILQGSSITGYFYGEGGVNTLDLTSFAPEEGSIDVKLHIGQVEDHYRKNFFGMSGINKFLGRKAKADQVSITCDSDTSDIKFVDGQSGSEEFVDHINIHDKDCAYEMQVVVRPNTVIYNRALKGDFHYIVPYALGSAKVDFIYTAEALNLNNTFAFEYEPAQIKNVDVRNINVLNKTSHIITFNFSPMSDKEFNITISGASNPSYRLGNNTEIKVGNRGNLYMLENTNKSVNEIIKDYLVVANRLNRMSFFIQSVLSNETVAIGSGNYEVIHNNPLQKSHLVGNGGENVYVIDSKRFEIPLPEVVIYDLDVESSVDTIDLRNLVQQARGKFSNSFKLQVFKSANDLLLKATVEKPIGDSSISENHEYFTVRLKDGVNWYNRTHVIMDNVPMRISLDNNEWSLKPQSLIFEKDKEVIVVTSQDVEENTELITPKKAGNYTFVRDHGSDLMITNAFNTQDDLCTIVLSKFYETPKMETLSIKFADKEIVLKDKQEEISTARYVDIVKREHKEQVYNDVFNRSPEVMLSDQPHRHQIRHRRSTSGSARPSSWINDLFGWVKSSIDGLLSSALSKETSSTSSPISQAHAPVDINGTIMLLDVIVRKFTGKQYIPAVDQSIPLLEARGYALNITNRFEKVLNKTAIKSGISVTNLNFDPVVVQSAIIGKIINGKFSEIAKTLYSIAKEACPEFKQTDKFLAHLKSNLEGEKETALLQQKIDKPSEVLDQQVSRKVELLKRPNTFLNGTSVVKGISNVLEL